MSSQEPLKKKSKRDNGLFCFYNECTCVDAMYFVFERAHAQSLKMHHRKTLLNVPYGGNNKNAVVYIGIATNYVTS